MKRLNEERLKAYFLGELSAAESEFLEESCAASAELTAQAQLIENELIDDYLQGNLPPRQLHSFETKYLITEARRRRLKLTENLRKIETLAEEQNDSIAPSPQKSFWQDVFAARNRLPLAAFAGLALFVLTGLAFFWLASGERQETAREAISEPAAPPSGPTINSPAPAGPETAVAPSGSAPPRAGFPEAKKGSNQNASAPKPPPVKNSPPESVARKAPQLAAFILRPGTLRGENEQSITIPQRAGTVDLQLNLPLEAKDKYDSFRATLKNGEGETVFTSPRLRAPKLSVPAEKLENQTYIIFLEGRKPKNESESITEYTFRVRR